MAGSVHLADRTSGQLQGRASRPPPRGWRGESTAYQLPRGGWGGVTEARTYLRAAWVGSGRRR